MALKITVPNSSSENLTFGSAQTPVAAEVVGIDSGSSNGQLAFKTTASGASTERMRIDASGNVGIGTTSTSNAKLNIQCAAATAYDGLLINNALGNGTLFLGTNSSTLVAGVFAQGGGEILEVGAQNYVKFTTGNIAGSATERMRIDSSGNVLVGTTTAAGLITSSCNSSSQNPLALIDTGTTYSTSNYYIRFVNSAGNTAGSVQHTAVTTVAYATTSDHRLKENIVDAPTALDKVNEIKVRSFDWIEDKRHTDYGFIAQELHQIFPDAVGKGDDTPTIEDERGTWQVEYGRLTPLLVKAIQELKAELDALKAKLEAK